MTNNSEQQKEPKIIQQHWASIEGKPLTPAVDLPRRVIKRSKVKPPSEQTKIWRI